MRKVLCAIFLIGGLSTLAWPQSGQGYFFIAPGQFRAAGHSEIGVHFGGGGRFVAKNGLGIGGELGMEGPKEDFGEYKAGLASVNGYYVFQNRSKVEPFVTGGYSRTFANNSGMNWGNFGVGLTWWVGKWAGLLVEYRDHITRQMDHTGQFWTVRFGVALGSRGEH